METMTESFGAGVRSAKTVESLKKSTRQSGKSRKRHPFYFAAPHKLPEQSVDPPVIPVPAAANRDQAANRRRNNCRSNAGSADHNILRRRTSCFLCAFFPRIGINTYRSTMQTAEKTRSTIFPCRSMPVEYTTVLWVLPR